MKLSVTGTLLAALIPLTSAVGQSQTVGLSIYDSVAYEGYTLFAPMQATTVYLIDMYGRQVHSWEGEYEPGNSVYLLENGHLLWTHRPGNEVGGLVREVDWEGNLLWEYWYMSSYVQQHHDIQPLPNGNVLILAWEFRTRAEALQAGRNPSLLYGPQIWPEHVIEVQPTPPSGGTIVWSWHVWDHLIQDYDPAKDNYGVVANHPELVDINYTAWLQADWLHANAVTYNPSLDQIMICSRAFCEFWIIDHSTTTAEAAGHTGGNSGRGGDILYRWGNPQTYRAGTVADKELLFPHDANWIESGFPGEGHIMVFNNGSFNRLYSTVNEIVTTVDDSGHYPLPAPGSSHDPEDPLWTYTASPPGDFFSAIISGARRLPNGNTLICEGTPGRLFEVTPEGETVWQYINPVDANGPVAQGATPGNNGVFRCQRYAADYPGLQGHDLTPGGRIEIYPVSISGTAHSPSAPSNLDTVAITATITDPSGIMSAKVYVDTGGGFFPLTMFDDGSHRDGAAGDDLFGATLPPLDDSITVRYYLYAQDSTAAFANDPPNPPATAYRFFVKLEYICGDMNGDHLGPNIVDLAYLTEYLFNDGPPPPLEAAADVNGGDGAVNIVDLSYFVAYLFGSGSAPNCGE